MKITVHFHSKLVGAASGDKRRVEVVVDEGTSIEGLIAQFELPVEAEMLLLGLNGEPANMEDNLHDGDTLHLILPVSGG